MSSRSTRRSSRTRSSTGSPTVRCPGYARTLAACAAKAPSEDATVMFAEHAAGAISAERELHAALREHFTTTSRYEWMFWDAGWRLVEWPV